MFYHCDLQILSLNSFHRQSTSSLTYAYLNAYWSTVEMQIILCCLTSIESIVFSMLQLSVCSLLFALDARVDGWPRARAMHGWKECTLTSPLQLRVCKAHLVCARLAGELQAC